MAPPTQEGSATPVTWQKVSGGQMEGLSAPGSVSGRSGEVGVGGEGWGDEHSWADAAAARRWRRARERILVVG